MGASRSRKESEGVGGLAGSGGEKNGKTGLSEAGVTGEGGSALEGGNNRLNRMESDTAIWDVGECLERIRMGDEAAAAALVDRLSPMVMKIAHAHLPVRQTVGDLAQEVFGRLFQRLDRYEVRAGVPFEHWVARLAVRTCLDLLRAERRRPEVREADLSEGAEHWLEYLVGEGEGAGAVPATTAVEAGEVVQRLLSALSVEDRLLISWVDLEEKPMAEIAAWTGWTRVGLRVRLHRARQRLRAVAERMRKEEDHGIIR